MPIIPAGYAQVTHIFVGSAMPEGAATTLGLDVNPLDTPLQVAEDCHVAYGANLQNLMSSEVVLLETLCKFGPDATGPSATFSDPIAGLQSTATVPPQVAILLKKQTALGGRKHRGRMYLPGPVENLINRDGAVDSAYLADFVTGAAAYLADIITAGYEPMVLHGDGTLPTSITEIVPDGRVATQRNRLR